jgi:hypothetical protein
LSHSQLKIVSVLLNIWSLSTGSVLQTVTWETLKVGDVRSLIWLDNRRLAIAFQFAKVKSSINNYLKKVKSLIWEGINWSNRDCPQKLPKFFFSWLLKFQKLRLLRHQLICSKISSSCKEKYQISLKKIRNVCCDQYLEKPNLTPNHSSVGSFIPKHF